jgi:predicted alternative tryptophan synthase beta-subunit
VESTFALAGAMLTIEVKVYMVQVSYGQKPYHRRLMKPGGEGRAETGNRIRSESLD